MTTKKQYVFSTIKAIAGALGVPVAVIRQAKKAGADGFRANGNVDLLALVRWLLTKGKRFAPQVDLESARATLAVARAEEITRAAEIVKGTMAPTEPQARALELGFACFSRSLPGVCLKISEQIYPHDNTGRMNKTYSAMTTTWRNVLLDSALAGVAQCNLPGWAADAIKRGAELGLAPDPAGDEWRLKIFRAMMSAKGEAAFIDSMARLTKGR